MNVSPFIVFQKPPTLLPLVLLNQYNQSKKAINWGIDNLLLSDKNVGAAKGTYHMNKKIML